MKKLLTATGTAVLALAATATSVAAMPLPARPAFATGAIAVEEIAYRRGFYVVSGVYYYNGYRGIVVARPGYRHYNGYWFPAAAFAAGLAVGGAIAHPVPPAVGLNGPISRWCYDHHRSYQAYDNTYEPYHGPRQQCWWP